MSTTEPSEPTTATAEGTVRVPPPPAPARGRRTTTATKAAASPATAAAEPTPGVAPDVTDTTGTTADGHRGVTLRLPLITATVRPPRLPRVGRRELAEAADFARSLLPPPDQALFFAGLGALVLVELIEWPVAAAVAAGTVVAQRGAERRAERRVFLPAPVEPAAG